MIREALYFSTFQYLAPAWLTAYFTLRHHFCSLSMSLPAFLLLRFFYRIIEYENKVFITKPVHQLLTYNEVISIYVWKQRNLLCEGVSPVHLRFKKCLRWVDLGGLLKKDEISSQKREEKDAGGM